MGIKNLNVLLRKHCPEVYMTLDLSNLAYKKSALDVSLYMFKCKTIFGDKWLGAMFNMIMTLRKNNIHVCFVFDTSAPMEKQKEQLARRETAAKLDARLCEYQGIFQEYMRTKARTDALDAMCKALSVQLKVSALRPEKSKYSEDEIRIALEKRQKQVVHLGKEDFDVCKEMLDCMGIPWLQAPMEAETTCADLCKQGKVDFVLSEDTDVLCYGAPIFITRVNIKENTGVGICYEDVVQGLQITHDQFLDLCIMCGCDYNKNIPGIGPEKAYKLLKEHGSIEGIASATDIDVSVLNYVRTREIFREYERCEDPIPCCKPPDMDKLQRFLVVNNVPHTMRVLTQHFTTADVQFE